MKKSAIRQVLEYAAEFWGPEKTAEIQKLAQERLAQLCRENAGAPRAVKAHTEKEIYPCVSLYEAMQKQGISKQEALEFLDESWSRRAEDGARKMKRILKHFGLFHLYPGAFSWTARTKFGANAGFCAKFYQRGKMHCKFDMTRCLYLDTCRRLGCGELTACFCHVDDVNNENLHPRLCWNRTQTMAEGAKCCDFDIFVK